MILNQLELIEKNGCKFVMRTKLNNSNLKFDMIILVFNKYFFFCRTICKTEKDVNSTDIEIKIEKDLIEGHTFEGIIFNKRHSSKLITRVNSDKSSNIRKNYSNEILARHLKINTNKRAKELFGSDICNKSYNKKSDLKIHTFLHNGQKPYKCDICDKVFPYRSILN